MLGLNVEAAGFMVDMVTVDVIWLLAEVASGDLEIDCKTDLWQSVLW